MRNADKYYFKSALNAQEIERGGAGEKITFAKIVGGKITFANLEKGIQQKVTFANTRRPGKKLLSQVSTPPRFAENSVW